MVRVNGSLVWASKIPESLVLLGKWLSQFFYTPDFIFFLFVNLPTFTYRLVTVTLCHLTLTFP